MITIGQLAAYAGVTIKAVRHYHQRGLLDEPPRDSSGYRRYGVEHAIELVKIRTLAEAGVPLARIRELLVADSDHFAMAISEIDRRLQERIGELLLTRSRIARLSSGDRLFVSPEVAEYLDQLRDLGVNPRAVQMERDLWILQQSVSPAQAAAWIADKREAMADPEFRTIYVDYGEAFDWSPDDPRLSELADRTEHWIASQRRQGSSSGQGDQAGQPQGTERSVTGSGQVPAMTEVIAASVSVASPAWARISEIARERKTSG